MKTNITLPLCFLAAACGAPAEDDASETDGPFDYSEAAQGLVEPGEGEARLCVQAGDSTYSGTSNRVVLTANASSVEYRCEIAASSNGGGIPSDGLRCCIGAGQSKPFEFDDRFTAELTGTDGLSISAVRFKKYGSAEKTVTNLDREYSIGDDLRCDGCALGGRNCDHCWMDRDGAKNCSKLRIDMSKGDTACARTFIEGNDFEEHDEWSDSQELCIKAANNSGAGSSNDVRLEYVSDNYGDGNRLWSCMISQSIGEGETVCCTDPTYVYTNGSAQMRATLHGSDGLAIRRFSADGEGSMDEFNPASSVKGAGCDSIGDSCSKVWADASGHKDCYRLKVKWGDNSNNNVVCEGKN